MKLRIFHVEHGACAMMLSGSPTSPLVMIDSGDRKGWSPSSFIKNSLGLTQVDYLVVTNADQDHLSDLDGLRKAGINVETIIRNPSPNVATLRKMKEDGGELTSDIEEMLRLFAFNGPVARPFDQYMGGITFRSYFNQYSDLEEQHRTTNNLSLAVFFKYAGFTVLFPGDLEIPGWMKLLEREDFRADLAEVNILVASHHGRQSGYCPEVFKYCTPQAAIFSDDTIDFGTQEGMANLYGSKVKGNGIIVRDMEKADGSNLSLRKVLTTRFDGDIIIEADANSNFTVGVTKPPKPAAIGALQQVFAHSAASAARTLQWR